MPSFSLSVRKRLQTADGERVLDITMEVGANERVALFGPSGAGKTTLLRMIAGLSTPDSGRIAFNNEVWFDSETGINVPSQNRGVGFVFQDYALFPAMSVEKNIAYGLRKAQTSRRKDFLLESFGLQEFRHRLPHTLSGGQRQRTALARALAPNPRILLLDEPLSALDPLMRASLQEELDRTHRQMPVPTILVSHDMAEIFRLSNRVFCLQSGAIVKSGPPREVFGGSDDRLRFTGTVLSKSDQGVLCILTVAVGAEVSSIAVLRDEAQNLSPGDRVGISAKSFNPDVKKLEIG